MSKAVGRVERDGQGWRSICPDCEGKSPVWLWRYTTAVRETCEFCSSEYWIPGHPEEDDESYCKMALHGI